MWQFAPLVDTLISRLLEDYEESLPSHKPPTTNKKKEVCLQTFFDEMGWSGTAPKTKPDILSDLKTPSNEVQEALKKSVLTEDFEKKHEVPPLEVSEKRLKKQRKVSFCCFWTTKNCPLLERIGIDKRQKVVWVTSHWNDWWGEARLGDSSDEVGFGS